MIRPETPEDVDAISRLHISSFPSDAESRLVDELRRANHLQVSLVAEESGEIIGHVAISPVTTHTRVAGSGLAPVAVLEEHRRQGIAASLIRAGLESCRVAGIDWVVVLGDPAYYRRFGFLPAAEFGLVDEYGGGPAFQIIALRAGSIPVNAGTVRYAPEFAMFG